VTETFFWMGAEGVLLGHTVGKAGELVGLVCHQEVSYGPGSDAPATGQVGVTCWNESDAAVPVHVLAVSVHGRPSTVEVLAFEPSVLTAAAETQLRISTATIPLRLRDSTLVEVRLRVGSDELVSVADVTTPERFPLRR
jgi:hypothetical protein